MYNYLLAALLSLLSLDDVFFRSDSLKNLSFSTEFHTTQKIKDDGDNLVEITGKLGNDGHLYWYRRLKTPVCLTGECRLIDVGIYWNYAGDFYGLEVYGEPLTKTDHKDFSEADYKRLISILEDDWSDLREYDAASLTDPVDSLEKTDGVTGATKREVADKAVEHAVYTTYTLWHLANVGEKEQIKDLSAKELNTNQALLKSLVNEVNQESYQFVFELLDLGKITPSALTDTFVLSSLKSGNLELRKQAFKSIKFSDINNSAIQNELAGVYALSQIDEKLKLLTILANAKSIDNSICQHLSNDLGVGNNWLIPKILNALIHCTTLSKETKNQLLILSRSSDGNTSTVAKKILESQR